MASHFRSISIACIFLLALTGCGGNDATAPVTGKVTFDGKPLADASVAFHPKGKGKICTATTAVDGTFTLALAVGEDSQRIPVGQYTIAVSAIEANESGSTEQSEMGSLNMMMSRKPPKPERSVLPRKFANPGTSGLSFEVRADEDNVASLDLLP